jgi:hypothetical protein
MLLRSRAPPISVIFALLHGCVEILPCVFLLKCSSWINAFHRRDFQKAVWSINQIRIVILFRMGISRRDICPRIVQLALWFHVVSSSTHFYTILFQSRYSHICDRHLALDVLNQRGKMPAIWAPNDLRIVFLFLGWLKAYSKF